MLSSISIRSCDTSPALLPRLCLVLSVAVAVGLGLPSPVGANAQSWPVHDKLIGKHGDKSEDVSGIACTTLSGFPRQCLVIDDDLQAAQFVIVEDGELFAGDPVPLIDNFFDSKKLELDGEGVAFYDHSFYVIGSHGHPRRDTADGAPHPEDRIRAKIAAVSQVVRVRLKSSTGKKLSSHDILEVTRTSNLRKLIAADATLKPFLDKPLQENGVTIEGIAIVDGRLFAGFRGPSIEGRGAPILSVPLTTLFDGGNDGVRLTVVRLKDGRGVRDLAPYKDGGMLVLAGPTGDEMGRYDVYWWDGSSVDMQHLGDITEDAHADEEHKPEGILPLDVSPEGLRVLILSDGKDAKEGEPRPVVVRVPNLR